MKINKLFILFFFALTFSSNLFCMQKENNNLFLKLRQRETFGKIPEETKEHIARFFDKKCSDKKCSFERALKDYDDKHTAVDAYSLFVLKKGCCFALLEHAVAAKREQIIHDFLDKQSLDTTWLSAFAAMYIHSVDLTNGDNASLFKRVVVERKPDLNLLYPMQMLHYPQRLNPELYNYKTTLLHDAAVYKDKHVVKLLLSLGANPKNLDGEGKSPADLLRPEVKKEGHISAKRFKDNLALLQEAKRKQSARLFAAGKRRKTNE